MGGETEVYSEWDGAKTAVHASPCSLLGLQPRRKQPSFGCPSTDELSGEKQKGIYYNGRKMERYILRAFSESA